MKNLLNSLYGDKYDVSGLEKRLEELINKYRKLRPRELIAFENNTTKLWYKDAKQAGYILYADLFSPEAKAGEKINALEKKLDYFEELGISFIHILPILKSSGDGGYAVDDYCQIDSRFGTNEDFKNLVSSAHKKGLRIALDFVLNHTSDNHRWAQKARAENKYYQDYYIWSNDGKPWPKVPDIFPDFAPGHWDFVPELNKWAWTTFYKRNPFPFAQWDLNYKNPEVLFAMLENLLFLANWGVDIFRLDAAPFLWKEKGTICMSLPQTYIILKILKYALDVVAPRSIFLAEAYQKPKDLVKYFTDGGVEEAYNYTLMPSLWYACAFGDVSSIKSTFKNTPPLPKSANWLTFTECHDQVDWGMTSRKFAEKMSGHFIKTGGIPFNKDKNNNFSWGISGTTWTLLGENVNLVLLLESVKFTLGYTPLIYMGEELGMESDPLYLKDPLKKDDSRFVKRVPVTNQKRAKKHIIFYKINELIKLRQKYPFIANPPKIINSKNNSVLIYSKSDGKQKITFLANFSPQHTEIKLHKARILLLPFEFKILLR